MTAFDQAWALVKMPYYHGASSADLESIMEHGLRPAPSSEDSPWPDMYDAGETYSEDGTVFMADNPLLALHYAIQSGSEERLPKREAPHRPVVLEISDDVEGLEGFDFNPELFDFQIRGQNIPPEMLRTVYEGDEYDTPDEYEAFREYLDQAKDKLRESDWFKQYMAMGDKRHPPFILREGLY